MLIKILYIILGTIVFFIIAGQIWARTASRPDLGIQNNKLLPLPNTPNCVATQSGQEAQKMPPIPHQSDRQTVQQHLLDILNQWPRTTLVTNEPGYIRVECRSPFFGFPDDIEFMITDTEIHFRAAARLGYSDMGVNRKRMEKFTLQFKK